MYTCLHFLLDKMADPAWWMRSQVLISRPASGQDIAHRVFDGLGCKGEKGGR